MAETIIEGFSLFRGKPLVRKDNIICCGDPKDKAVLVLTVLTYKEVFGEQVPNDILIQIQSTDSSVPIVDRTLKQGIKKGLSEALDFGSAWLDSALH